MINLNQMTGGVADHYMRNDPTWGVPGVIGGLSLASLLQRRYGIGHLPYAVMGLGMAVGGGMIGKQIPMSASFRARLGVGPLEVEQVGGEAQVKVARVREKVAVSGEAVRRALLKRFEGLNLKTVGGQSKVLQTVRQLERLTGRGGIQ